jgi:hypothetical protein
LTLIDTGAMTPRVGAMTPGADRGGKLQIRSTKPQTNSNDQVPKRRAGRGSFWSSALTPGAMATALCGHGSGLNLGIDWQLPAVV